MALCPAERKRERDRERKRRQRARPTGSRFASTHLSPDVIEGLIRDGWTSAEEAKDPTALGDALADLADCYCNRRLPPQDDEDVTGGHPARVVVQSAG